MSRVTFHSPSGEAELLGRERAHANMLTNRIAHAALPAFRLRERYEPLLPPDSYLRVVRGDVDELRWDRQFITWWDVGDEPLHVPGKGLVRPWDLTLNTALVAGSDAVEWMARLHATCEVHGYVEGPNREWLADIIEDGCHDKVLRSGMGWDDVTKLLRTRDDEPVVMSYSVTESFPNAHMSDWMPPWPEGVREHYDALTPEQQRERSDREDAWWDLPTDEQWARSLPVLREQRDGPLELQPDTWGVQGFGPLGWSVFDLEDWLDGHEFSLAGDGPGGATRSAESPGATTTGEPGR